jgi:hypothetical protein
MPEVDDGVVEVLRHGVAGTKPGTVFDEQLTGGGVLVF